MSADLSDGAEPLPVRCVVDLTSAGGVCLAEDERPPVELPLPFAYVSRRTGLDRLGLGDRATGEVSKRL